MRKSKQFENAISRLSDKVYNLLINISITLKEQIYEVRIRVGQPLQIIGEFGTLFIRSDSSATSDYTSCGYKLTKNDISDSLSKLCDYSVHTHLEQIQKGFITINGGHRVGICGTAVVKEEKIYNIRDVSSLNLRVAHQIIDCSKIISDNILFSDNSLIISGPPSSGKTTVLRDISKRLSEKGKKVVVIDERFEIASCCDSQINNDLGPSCDVLSGFSKMDGIIIAIRTLSPDVVVCDEIGDIGEADAILQGFNSGVRFIVSIHSKDFSSLENKPQFNVLMNSNEFGFVVILSNEKNIRKTQIINLKENI